jgi:hypothetical protein
MCLTKKILSTTLVLSCLSIAAWGLLSAFQYGTASIEFYRVNNILSLWQTNEEQQSEVQYLLAKNGMLSAIKKHPNHPLYIDTMAQIYEWGSIAGYEDSKKALATAKQYYLQATQLRPSWAVTWASLVMVKWRLQEFDQEMLSFLANADKFGPFKPEVHILYSQLGLALYKNNNPLLIIIRPVFERHLALGMRNRKSIQTVINTINNNGLNRQVCRWLRFEPKSTTSPLKCK